MDVHDVSAGKVKSTVHFFLRGMHAWRRRME